MKEQQQEQEKKVGFKERLKQMGVLAFLFFFIKGLVWLAIFFGLGKWIKEFF